MLMYWIAIIPIIDILADCFTVQKWYADDGYIVGFLDNLKKSFGLIEKTWSCFRLPS